MQIPLLRLQCGVNSYDWGKTGADSAAAQFAAATPAAGFTIEADKPYAELWMGTHPSNPSTDVRTGRTLLDLVQDNQALLGPAVAAQFGRTLPFLFKVLSIRKALSIQAHPNKALAETLHARDPAHYPDDNHKPEMAIALTPFEGLCGFRPLGEIAHFLRTVPALRAVVGADASAAFLAAVAGRETEADAAAVAANKAALRALFSALMTASADTLAAATDALLAEVAADTTSPDDEEAEDDAAKFAGGGVPASPSPVLRELIPRLHGAFGVDVGLFCLFFLNIVALQPGEALFLRADDVHAYISGDIIECMAASDNVVRAGFTPKFKDVPTLTAMLTYGYAPIAEQLLRPVAYPYATLNAAAYGSGSACLLYDPPIAEFSVLRTALKRNGARATLDPLAGPSIVICTAGQGTIAVGPAVEPVRAGYVFFVGATAEPVLAAAGLADGDEFVTFTAFCEMEDHSNGA